ncbi:MAG: TIR domain-containing protein [Planctomycetaceae bacterium]
MATDKLRLPQQRLNVVVAAFDPNDLAMEWYFFRGEPATPLAGSTVSPKQLVFDLLVWADNHDRLLEVAERFAEAKGEQCAELRALASQLRQVLGTSAVVNTPVSSSPAERPVESTARTGSGVTRTAAGETSLATPSTQETARSLSEVSRTRSAGAGVSVYFATPTPDARGQADLKSVIDSVKQIKQWPVRVLSAPEIFVSFAWGDDQTQAGVKRQQAVDELCGSLENQGFLVRRDSQEIRYGGVISDYMQRLGRSDRVLVILSEKYLRSISCMTELHAIYQRSQGEQEEFLQRVIPVALEDARFSTPEERVSHARYWQDRSTELKQNIDLLGPKDLQLLRDMRRWSQEISEMLAFLNDTLAPRRLEEIRQAEFQALRELLRSSAGGAPAENPLEQATLFVQVLGEQGSKVTAQSPWGLEERQFLAARQAGIPCLRWRPRDLDLDTVRRHHPEYVEYLSGAADPTDLPPEERVQAGYLPDFQKLIEETLLKVVARETKAAGTISPGPTPTPTAVIPPARPDPSAGPPASSPMQTFVPSTTAAPHPAHRSGRASVLFAPQHVDETLAATLDEHLRSAFGTTVATEIASAEYPLSAVYENERGVLVIYGQGSLDWVQERVRECRDIALDRARNAPVCALYVGPPDGKPPLKKRPAMVRIIPHDDPEALRRYLAELTNGGPA